MSMLSKDAADRIVERLTWPAQPPKRTRPPMLRRLKDGDGMNLPLGRTCADCVRCHRCCSIFGHIPQDQVCDWAPSRFIAANEGKTP